MKQSSIETYLEYIRKRGSCISVFRVISDMYGISSGIYPGSYIHITPSLVIPEMFYVDSDKKAIRFFENRQEIEAYLTENKEYSETTILDFDGADFTQPLKVKHCNYDLLISLYSGFISQHCKEYLRKGGILLANDSHGDATIAFHDPDYEFIGVISDDENRIETNGDALDRFFKMKSGKKIDLDKVMKQMKGPNYHEKVEYYLFRKLL